MWYPSLRVCVSIRVGITYAQSACFTFPYAICHILYIFALYMYILILFRLERGHVQRVKTQFRCRKTWYRIRV